MFPVIIRRKLLSVLIKGVAQSLFIRRSELNIFLLLFVKRTLCPVPPCKLFTTGVNSSESGPATFRNFNKTAWAGGTETHYKYSCEKSPILSPLNQINLS